MAEILLLSRSPASGKTTVAGLLSERYDRVAHIDADAVRRLRNAGLAPPLRQDPEPARQHRLAVLNAGALARNFIEDEVGVVIEDIVLPASLNLYLDELTPSRVRIHFVRLMPSLESCHARNRMRDDERVRPAWLDSVYRAVAKASDFAGVAIDSTHQTPLETADRLQALTTRGESVIWPSHAA
ncbi:MAG: hypothetical protein GEU75_13260 [Dehalococcoidia bacterium]|nr:hypothetical protein [Dehalococcoidia bacterium]